MKLANEIWLERGGDKKKTILQCQWNFFIISSKKIEQGRQRQKRISFFLFFFFDAISFFDINRVSREKENVQSNQDNALLFSIFENYELSKRYCQIYSIRNIINIHFLDKLSTNLSFDATMDRWRQIWTRYRNLNTLEPIRYLRAEFVSWPNTDTNDRI